MFVPVGTEEQPGRKIFPWVTVAIVVLNVGVYLLELAVRHIGGDAALGFFFQAFGVVPVAVSHTQDILIPFYLTPFTSMFVHAGTTHLLFNMLFLLVFGDNVEDRIGHGRFLILYLVSGLGGALLHVLLQPASSVPAVGASGAIAGVLGAYLLLFPRGRVRMFIFLGPLTRIRRVHAWIYIGIWFLSQFLNGTLSLGVETAETGGVAYWAHIGGFGLGLLLALIRKLTSGSQPGLIETSNNESHTGTGSSL